MMRPSRVPRVRAMAAALVVAAIGISGLGVGVWSSSRQDEVRAAPPITPAVALPSVCGLSETAPAGATLTVPPVTEWVPLGYGVAPTVAGHGPGVIDPETQFRACFARTPAGALLAAANIAAMGATPELVPVLAERSVVPGRGHAELVAKIAAAGPGAETVSVARILGFRVLQFAGDHAQIDLAARVNVMTVSAVYDLVWSGGDWRLAVTPEGEFGISGRPLSSTAGYIPWGPA